MEKRKVSRRWYFHTKLLPYGVFSCHVPANYFIPFISVSKVAPSLFLCTIFLVFLMCVPHFAMPRPQLEVCDSYLFPRASSWPLLPIFPVHLWVHALICQKASNRCHQTTLCFSCAETLDICNVFSDVSAKATKKNSTTTPLLTTCNFQGSYHPRGKLWSMRNGSQWINAPLSSSVA